MSNTPTSFTDPSGFKSILDNINGHSPSGEFMSGYSFGMAMENYRALLVQNGTQDGGPDSGSGASEGAYSYYYEVSRTDSSAGYESNPDHVSTNPWPAALAVSGALVVDDATGIGMVDDVLIPVIIAGALAYDLTQRGYVTYTLYHPDGRIYAGRASGFGTPRQIMMQRYYGHHARLEGFGSPKLDQYAQGIPGRAAIRGREQQLIDSLGGAGAVNVGNRIRGVAKWNPFGTTYHKASDGYFGPLAPYTGY